MECLWALALAPACLIVIHYISQIKGAYYSVLWRCKLTNDNLYSPCARSFQYVLFQAFGLAFYMSGGIALLAMDTAQSLAIAAGVFAIISAVLHGLHGTLVYLKRKKWSPSSLRKQNQKHAAHGGFRTIRDQSCGQRTAFAKLSKDDTPHRGSNIRNSPSMMEIAHQRRFSVCTCGIRDRVASETEPSDQIVTSSEQQFTSARS